jgi:hypothetical protein
LTSFVSRLGKMVPTDAVFEAWTSQDLDRMRAVMSVRTNVIERHFLLMGIVEQSYRRRSEPDMLRLCLEAGRRHVEEFSGIVGPLSEDLGILPHVTSFAYLAMALAEEGEFDEAVAVCEKATAFGLHDGTKGDFAGRIKRIRKEQARGGSRPQAPSERRGR